MNKMKKGCPVLLLCLMLVLSLLPVQGYAIDPIDLDREVSMAVTYQYGDVKLTGAKFDIYRVADMDRFAVFTPGGDFAGDGHSIKNLEEVQEWDELAQELADYVQSNASVQPLRTGSIGTDGACRFESLTAGLYLVVGHELKIDKTTYTCNPFLISLPNREDNAEEWTYDNVSVKPKAGEPSTEPMVSPDELPYLPDTGMLWWPVPVLISAGLLLILVGLMRRKGTRHEA